MTDSVNYGRPRKRRARMATSGRMPTKHINRVVFQRGEVKWTRTGTRTTTNKQQKIPGSQIWDQNATKPTPDRPGASWRMLLGAAEVGSRSAR